MLKLKARKLDAPTKQQAIAAAQWLIGIRGGLSHEYSQEYWRFSTKAELCGQVEAGERFVEGIKDALKEHGEVSVSFLPGPGKWNEALAAKLIADAKQGDADADQVLREAAADFLAKRILPPDELADYAAAYLQQATSSKKQSHKTEYRDWILALTVDDVARHFNLHHTRNEATEAKGKHCACSVVALAVDLHENIVQNAWHDYKGVADQRTRTNYVAQAMVSKRGSRVRASPVMFFGRVTFPRVLSSDDTQEHFLVRFPRVGSGEAMSRPSNRKAQRAKRAKAQRAKRGS